MAKIGSFEFSLREFGGSLGDLGTLLPLAVDATLLGADGVAALARAAAAPGVAPRPALETALTALEAACAALGVIASGTMPAPIEALSAEEVAGVEAIVREAGLLR